MKRIWKKVMFLAVTLFLTVPGSIVYAEEEWPEPASEWYTGYEYTINGDTLWLNQSKGTLSGNITIPATVTVGTKEYKVGLNGGKSGSESTGIWRPDRYNITGIRIEQGVDAGSSTNCLFNNLNSVKTIDVSGLDTSRVTDMSFMFSNCFGLTKLTLGSMDTSQVTNMKCMFNDCRELPSLDLSNLDTSKVTDMSSMFAYDRALSSLSFGENFKTGNVTDMSGMFSSCEGLTSLDVSGFDTSKVTDFSNMFEGCSSIESLNVSGFRTGSATNMSYMFDGCGSLTSLDVSGFDTSGVRNMQDMFAETYLLKSLDLRNFDTRNVQYMSKMFYLTGLRKLDVSSFDTSNVTNFSDMFSCCDFLEELDVTNFNTEKARSMDGMFTRCAKLKTLDLSHFNTGKVTRMREMFAGTEELTDLDLRSFDFTALNNDSQKSYWGLNNFMGPINWSGNYGVVNLYLPVNAMSDYDFESGTRGTEEDRYDYNLKNIYYAGTKEEWDALNNTLPEGVTLTCEYNASPEPAPQPVIDEEWYEDYVYTLTDTELRLHRVKDGFSVTNVQIPARQMINGREYAVVLDREQPEDGYRNWDGLWVYFEKEPGYWHRSPVKTISFEEGVRVAEDADSLFENMVELETVNLTGLDTSAVTTMERWFYACPNLSSVTFGTTFDSSQATRFNLMFGNCQSLKTIDLSAMDTGKGSDLSAMFDCCEKLESLDLSGFDTSGMTNMVAIFSGCESLKTLDLSSFRTEKLEAANVAFSGCSSLTELNLGSFSTPKLEQMAALFQGCTGIRRLDLRSFDFTAANRFMELGSSNGNDFSEFAFGGLVAGSGIVDLYLPAKAMKNYNFTTAPAEEEEGYRRYGNIPPYLKHIYYAGTREEWEALHNTLPAGVTVTYDYTGEMQPVTEPEEPEPVTHDYVTGLSLDASELCLLIGGTKTLRTTLTPSNVKNTTVTWTSSKEDVATVEGGVITAISGGTAIITAKAEGAEQGKTVSASCIVRVTPSQVQEGDQEGRTPEETAGFWLAGIDAGGYSYTGAAITPSFRLYYGTTLLTEGTDYKTVYKNNKAVKEITGGGDLYQSASVLPDKKAPYIQITLKGNYSGTIIRTFSIVKKNLGDGDITVVNASGVANGKTQKLKPALYRNGKAIAAKEYSFDGNGWQSGGYKEAGTYKVTIRASETGSYTGTTEALVVLKKAEGLLNLASLKPVTTASKAELVYDGEEKRPAYTLNKGNASAGLTESTDGETGDYRVFYENNVEIGTATARFVALEGSEKCYGTKSVSFKILKPAAIDLTKNASKANDSVIVKLLDELGEVMETPSAVYAKGGVMPKALVTVQVPGEKTPRILTEGRDYVLSYKNNKKVNTENTPVKSMPTVIVSGKGAYKGKAELTFNIRPQELNKLTLLVDDIVLNPDTANQKAYEYQKTGWTLTDLDGKVLKMGTDYVTVKKGAKESHGTSYKADGEKLAPGSVVILTLTAKEGSNYTGSISASYRVIEKARSIKGATVTVNNSGKEKLFYANGSSLELSESDLSVRLTKNGNPLNSETDYEIVSFSGNTAAGKKATLTIRGKGSYGGLKTVTLQIAPLKYGKMEKQ